jgi:hypothetical protein
MNPAPVSEPNTDHKKTLRQLGNAMLFYGIAATFIGCLQMLRTLILLASDATVPATLSRAVVALLIIAAGLVWIFCSASFRKLSQMQNYTTDDLINSTRTLVLSFLFLMILAILRIVTQGASFTLTTLA